MEWKKEIHLSYKLLINELKDWIIDINSFCFLEKLTPKEHYTRNNDSIIYPIFWQYEAYNWYDEPKRFDTLEEAKNYFN